MLAWMRPTNEAQARRAAAGRRAAVLARAQAPPHASAAHAPCPQAATQQALVYACQLLHVVAAGVWPRPQSLVQHER